MDKKIGLPKLPKINWKLFFIVIIILIIALTSIKFVYNFISGGNREIAYKILEEDEIPEEIVEILPRYKMLERALATKVDDDVYVIVTRGEKLTEGYKVDIKEIEFVNMDDESKVIVHVLFEDPHIDDLVAQVVSYPYVVAKTNLGELPPRIDLEIIQKE